ncbi:vacuolar fusion protein MON1 homolog A-like [Symsagittifera roscoffensis]|uniref:vacuolar fusion protein MON1 homolog A-like n=1 Tax=Symsagittifera roscoffensis TaxID=84072 RepID=UPI00307B56E0
MNSINIGDESSIENSDDASSDHDFVDISHDEDAQNLVSDPNGNISLPSARVVTSELQSFLLSDSGDYGVESSVDETLISPLKRHPSGLTVKEIQRRAGFQNSTDTSDNELSQSITSSSEDSSKYASVEHGVHLNRSGTLVISGQSQEELSAIKARQILMTQEKHMFILSSAGKPIYTRHSQEDEHLPLFGVMTALVSFISVENDTLSSIRTKDRLFVFLVRSPLILVGVSGLKDSVNQLARQLSYMYNQVISLVSAKMLQARFKVRENYDLRRLLDDSGRKYLDGMCDMMENNPSVLLGSVHCVKLKGNIRDLIGRSLVVDVKDLVFNVLMARNQLIQYSHMRSCMLQPSDMHILFNLVARTGNFRDTDIAHWLPICLPGPFNLSFYTSSSDVRT